MCIAILKPKDVKIDNETLRNAWDANPDGAGFAFAQDGKIMAFKSMDEDTFIGRLNSAMNKANTAFMIHFRIATQGTINLDNAHPFAVNKNLFFCHNGIIPNMPKSREISDTRFFNMDILQKLPFKLNNKTHDTLIANAIGYSKLIFLNSSEEYQIVNEHLGTWQAGAWHSNLSACATAESFLTDDELGEEWAFNGMAWNKQLTMKGLK